MLDRRTCVSAPAFAVMLAALLWGDGCGEGAVAVGLSEADVSSEAGIGRPGPAVDAAVLSACPPLPAEPAAGQGEERFLYPAPRFVDMGLLEGSADTVCFDTSALSTHAKLDALLPELAAQAGLSPAPFDCSCAYRVAFASQAPTFTGGAAQAWTAAGQNVERYSVSTSTTSGRSTATLFAASERAALYAVRAALALAQEPAAGGGPRVATATVVDHPTFSRRGVIEGIYNPDECTMLSLPWRVGERLATIHLVSGLRGNAYLYGPKCDPYSRDEWQVPYPAGSSDEQVIRVALHEAERHMLDFIWAVSPGVKGLAAVDPAKLEAKIDAMRSIGVSHFALFLDDIDDHAAAPQVALINTIDDYIRATAPNERLLVVGTTYCGHSGNFYNCEGPNAYTDQLGAKVHPTVDLMWTGEDVIPDTMSAADMTAINASFARKVTIWDNGPLTDTGFSGRASDLGTAASGYFSNPVLCENGSPIRSYFEVLGPIADYLWATERYVAAASYADWQPRLDAIDEVDACAPCGARPDGWICDDTDAHRILFCDPKTKCMSAHACPGGCVVGAPGVEDVCR
jgi:hypothetical protein